MEAGILKKEKYQFTRWINLAVGILQLKYWVEGDSWFIFTIALANIGAFVFTRK